VTDTSPSATFLYEEHPDHPGWMRWGFTDPSRYNSFLGPMMVRVEGGIARVRMTPERRHSNLRDSVHGGALLGFIDVALFAASRSFGLVTAGSAVTLDLSTQFIGGGRIGEPLEAQVELLRETGRLLFLRGLVVQEEDKVASFSATIRKSARVAAPPVEA
jgi:uncharacterized protein (TIGR00369 family)